MGAKAIASALKINKTLKILDLYYNNIYDFGAIKIGEALNSNNSIQSLNLCILQKIIGKKAIII